MRLIYTALCIFVSLSCAAQAHYSLGAFIGKRLSKSHSIELFDGGRGISNSLGLEASMHFGKSSLSLSFSVEDFTDFRSSSSIIIGASPNLQGLSFAGPFFQENRDLSNTYIALIYQYGFSLDKDLSLSLGAGLSWLRGQESRYFIGGDQSNPLGRLSYQTNTENRGSGIVTATLTKRLSESLSVGLRSEMDALLLNPALQLYFFTSF